MTFRDYAQGAFRMRGIGKGQTMHLFAIPEVNSLISKVSKSSPPQTTSSDSGAGLQKILRDVVGWLVVNSMKSETVQFNMLCEQAIYNVFRKNGFNTIQTNYKNFGTKGISQPAILALDLFRERLDFSVENAIPVHILLHQLLVEDMFLTFCTCPIFPKITGISSREPRIPHF
jgi:hypothetical protein